MMTSYPISLLYGERPIWYRKMLVYPTSVGLCAMPTTISLHQALFLCAPFLFKMENGHLLSSSLPLLDKCHETSRIFPRTEQTFASARSFGVISWASFSRKNGPFGFERAPSASQKALSKSKGTFLRENECAKWYQNFGTVKICEGNGEYLWSSVAFVKV